MSANYTAQGCHPVKALGKKNLPHRSETFSLKSAIKVRGKRAEDLRLILFSNIDVALQHQLLLWEGFIKINLVTTFWFFFSLEVKTRPSKATVDGRVNWARKMFKCEPCVTIRFSLVCSIYLQGHLYPYEIQGHILEMLTAQNRLNAFTVQF